MRARCREALGWDQRCLLIGRGHLRACLHWTVASSLPPFGPDRRTIPRGRAQSRNPAPLKQTTTAADTDS